MGGAAAKAAVETANPNKTKIRVITLILPQVTADFSR
jgi:hypothetical protein